MRSHAMPTEQITFWAFIKNLLYVPAVFVGISMENYTILAVLLVVDVITGAWRSGVVNGGASITSWRAINGMISKFLFLLIPITVAYMAHGVGIEVESLARAALGILIFSTGYSIIGNIYTITTGKKVVEFDAVRLILLQLERMLDRLAPPDHKSKP